jgi:hypothetical protein
VRTLAALVLLAVVAAGCTTDDETSRQARGAPTLTPSSPTTPAQPPRPPRLNHLPTGPPPRIAYAEGHVIVHPDGRRERLVGQRRVGLSAFTRFRDGWLVADARFFEGTVGLAYVAGRHREDIGPCATGGAVLSADGERAAWVTQFCPESDMPPTPTVIHVGRVHEAVGEQRTVARPHITFVHGFVDDEVVVGEFQGPVQLAGPDGQMRTLPGLDMVGDVAGQRCLVAGGLRGGDEHGGIYDVCTGEFLWKRRHALPWRFSPDGRMVLSHVRRRAALLDVDSGETVALVKSGLSILDWQWEDDRHLLGVVSDDDGRQVVVRVDLRGNVTRATAVVETNRGWGLILETQP